MLKQLSFLLFLRVVVGIIYIDRMRLDFNERVSNWSINYIHDQTGNTVVNITFEIFDTLNKALIYVSAKAAKDHNDKECQIELVNTVIDAKKFLNGMQGHFILRGFISELLKSMKFDPKFPLQAVSEWNNLKNENNFFS